MYRNSAVYLVHFLPRLVFVKRSFTCFYRKKLWSCLQNMCFTKRCLFFMIWNSWGVGRWTELYLTLSTWSHQTVPTSTIRKSNPKGENAFLKVCVYIARRLEQLFDKYEISVEMTYTILKSFIRLATFVVTTSYNIGLPRIKSTF